MPKRDRVAELHGHMRALEITRVTEEASQALRSRMDPISDRVFERALRESGLPLVPIVEGVRQENLDDLDRTLCAMSAEYEEATNPDRKRRIRRIVLTAKDHAKYASARSAIEERRAMKRLMVERMLVWLENPPIYRQWSWLRGKAAVATAE